MGFQDGDIKVMMDVLLGGLNNYFFIIRNMKIHKNIGEIMHEFIG